MGVLLIALAVVVAVLWFAWLVAGPREQWLDSNVVVWLQAAGSAMLLFGGPIVAMILLVLGFSMLAR